MERDGEGWQQYVLNYVQDSLGREQTTCSLSFA